MFPHPTAPTNAAPHRPRAGRLRRALDVVIAFATLADDAPGGRAAPGSRGAARAGTRRADRAPRAAAAASPAPPPVAWIPPATAAARARGRKPQTGASALRIAPVPSSAAPAGSPEPVASRSTPTVGRAAARAAAPRSAPAAARATQPRHPHRRSLRAPARNRRPGAVRAAPQPCLTPLPARHAGRGRTPLAPSR